MDKIEITTIELNSNVLYNKMCPFGVNDEIEHTTAYQIPVIRAVGSQLCQRCESFIKIHDNKVWCK